MEILLRDAKGRIKGKYDDGKKDIAPKKKITLTIDIQLQILGENWWREKWESIVAIEPATGEILAMVSNPGFDPSILVGRQRSKTICRFFARPYRPLMNRATQALYSPGSAFKTIQALVCQEMEGITDKTLFSCNGPGSTPIKCTHHHGSPVSLLNAIEQSCNPYFWHAFRSTIEKRWIWKENLSFRTNYDEWVDRIKALV